MKKLLTMAAAVVISLGAGTVLHAAPYAADIEVPDVQQAPEVGATQEEPRLPAAQDGVTRTRPAMNTLPTFDGGAATVSLFPTLSFGAGYAGTYDTDAEEFYSFISLYMEGYPFVLSKTLGFGYTVSFDVVPISDGTMVAGAQADMRWVFAPMFDGGAWLDCRIGPSYESGSNSLRLYGYMDLGLSLALGKTLLETRMGTYLTGTGVGIVLSAGMSL